MTQPASSDPVATERPGGWIERQRTRPPAPTRWWYLALLFGLATAGFSVVLTQIFPASGAAILPGYGAPVIAFEFARSQADLLAIFGASNDPQQSARLLAMRTGNEQDYLFMLLYAGFLASGCIALWRELRLPLLGAAAALPILAALSDGYENWLLFDIQSAFTLGEYSPAMASLPVPVMAKFLLLTATNLAIGYALTQMTRRWRLAGILIIIPCLATVMALIAPAAFGWTLAAAIGAGWLGLLATAAIGAFYALVRKKPLVNFEPQISMRRATDQGAAASTPAPAPQPDRPKTFGRRKTDR